MSVPEEHPRELPDEIPFLGPVSWPARLGHTAVYEAKAILADATRVLGEDRERFGQPNNMPVSDQAVSMIGWLMMKDMIDREGPEAFRDRAKPFFDRVMVWGRLASELGGDKRKQLPEAKLSNRSKIVIRRKRKGGKSGD